MKKRTLGLALAAAMTATLAVPAFADEDKEPVTLRFMWWGGDARAEATLDVIEAYEKEHPWVTIEAEYGSSDGYQEKLTTQLVSGNAADIIQMGTGWMPGYVESNEDYFVDFNEYSDSIDLAFPDTRSCTILIWRRKSDLIFQSSTHGMICWRWARR